MQRAAASKRSASRSPNAHREKAAAHRAAKQMKKTRQITLLEWSRMAAEKRKRATERQMDFEDDGAVADLTAAPSEAQQVDGDAGEIDAAAGHAHVPEDEEGAPGKRAREGGDQSGATVAVLDGDGDVNMGASDGREDTPG